MRSMLKQTIILSTNINESEKLKSLAIFGKKTINRHYYNALELAKYLLQLSGVVIEEAFISNAEVAARLYKQIKTLSYFEKATYKDIYGLIVSINDLRRYIVSDESKAINDKLPMAPFKAKNEAIKAVYQMMVELFKEGFIDEVGIIRYALNNIKTFSNIDFINFDDEYPLHQALLNKAAGKEIAISDTNDDKPLSITSYTKAFGQTNEVENIINYIIEKSKTDKSYSFDQCLIASAETKDYANIFANYRDLLGIPLTIGTGAIVLESRPGKLFSIINDWIDNFYNTDYLKRIIYDESFNLEEFKKVLSIPDDDFKGINKELSFPETISLDSIITTVGDMKMSFDKESNNQKLSEYCDLLNKYVNEKYNEDNTKRRVLELQYVASFVEELNKGFIYFIDRYAVISDKKSEKAKDENAKSKILKYLSYHFDYDIDFEDVKKTIFAQNVGRESSKEGTLYFTSINNAISCLRPHLFIIGLCSNSFPGVSKENPFLLDDDYDAFGVDRSSYRDINNNKATFFRLLNEANKECKSIHLSYAYYNSQTLKEQNASSVIFETYKRENGNDKTIEDLNNDFKNDELTKYVVVDQFFNNNVLPIARIGRAVANNEEVSVHEVDNSNNETAIDLTKVLKKPNGFSASSVTNYAHCPYLFYITEILRMEQLKETDVYEVIAANELGTLAHYLLETLDKSKVKTKEEFGAIAGKKFEEYLIIHRPNNFVKANLEKEDFIDMMKNAYIMEGNSKTLFREEDICCDHSSGIRIHGFPDKVIENPDGTVRVIDYKTGNSVKHASDDIASMIQCTMYSYIIEQKKSKHVTSFEYWYLKHKYIVRSSDLGKTMDEHYNNLNNVLEALYTSLTTGEFIPNQSYCENCYYKNVCMKAKGGK